MTPLEAEETAELLGEYAKTWATRWMPNWQVHNRLPFSLLTLWHEATMNLDVSRGIVAEYYAQLGLHVKSYAQVSGKPVPRLVVAPAHNPPLELWIAAHCAFHVFRDVVSKVAFTRPEKDVIEGLMLGTDWHALGSRLLVPPEFIGTIGRRLNRRLRDAWAEHPFGSMPLRQEVAALSDVTISLITDQREMLETSIREVVYEQ